MKSGDRRNAAIPKADAAVTTAAPKKTFSGIPINVLIRSLFLCYYGSLGSLMPYLPVYYDSLGHGGQIIGLLGAVKPATTFIVAPVWGLLADQLQNPFLILQLTFLVSLVGQLLLACRDDARFITAMVFVTALFNAPVKSLLDSMVLDHIPDKTEYGRLRLWGQMGFGLGSSLVGVLLSKSKQIHFRDTTTHPELEVWLAEQFTSSYVRQAIRFLDKFCTNCSFLLTRRYPYLLGCAFKRFDGWIYSKNKKRKIKRLYRMR